MGIVTLLSLRGVGDSESLSAISNKGGDIESTVTLEGYETWWLTSVSGRGFSIHNGRRPR